MLVKIRFRFGFFRARFLLNFALLFLVLLRFRAVLVVCRTTEGHLRIEDRGLDSLCLIVGPLVGRFDLRHHRFVRVLAGKQSGDRGKNRKNCGAQRDPCDPAFAAMFGRVMRLLVQTFERHFGFFHWAVA